MTCRSGVNIPSPYNNCHAALVAKTRTFHKTLLLQHHETKELTRIELRR
jgi:hypothetical protein